MLANRDVSQEAHADLTTALRARLSELAGGADPNQAARPSAAPRAEPLDLAGAAVPGPTKPPAAPEEVERCLTAIGAAPDPSVPFNAMLDLRRVHPVDHKRLTAALRHALLERQAPPAPDPALADRPPLPARGKTASGTPKMF